ncbi:MAG: hypothetical protein NFCOHLIN_02053 [Gammaproteobacteria bacterium]|nr:hypothetical protein [Gammaproteobacteria bacterium]
MLGRLLRHLSFPHTRLRHAFPPETLNAIEQAIRTAERAHFGEIRFAVESALEPGALWRGESARERGMEVFAELHVWDTEYNNGVLIYALLADRDVEIVADRGLARHVDDALWQKVCDGLQQAYARGEYLRGSLAAIEEVSRLLARHFPADGENPNELPDRPYVR